MPAGAGGGDHSFGSKSLKTRITVITFAIVLLGSWSLALLVSRLLERDMVQLLSNQQFSLATLLAKEIDQELAMRLDMLERVAIAAELPMQQGPAAIQAYVEAQRQARSQHQQQAQAAVADWNALHDASGSFADAHSTL